MTEPLCTCGKRPKHKCCEESEHKSGKMCLREFKDLDNTVIVNFSIEINDHCPVYAFGMWMKFNIQHDYLNWQDTLRKG